jgi:hypothetical protein
MMNIIGIKQQHAETLIQHQGKVRAFAQRMFQLRSNLEKFFLITERPAGGHKTLFTFTPKQEEDEL